VKYVFCWLDENALLYYAHISVLILLLTTLYCDTCYLYFSAYSTFKLW